MVNFCDLYLSSHTHAHVRVILLGILLYKYSTYPFLDLKEEPFCTVILRDSIYRLLFLL